MLVQRVYEKLYLHLVSPFHPASLRLVSLFPCVKSEPPAVQTAARAASATTLKKENSFPNSKPSWIHLDLAASPL